MADLRRDRGVPKTQARLRWNATLNVGLDLEDILGLSTGVTNTLASVTSLIQKNLKPFGSVESVDFSQAKQIYERFALGPDSAQPFQTIPLNTTNTLKLSRVLLKNMQDAERVFNFFPNNLLHQQLPFVIQLVDTGDGETPETQITHYFFGCWFADSGIRYETLSKDDQKLIQGVTIRPGRVLTLDNSVAGNPIVNLAQNIVSGVLVTPGVENLIDSLPLA
jgi:hypothetical protein